MVGLRIILENQRNGFVNRKNPQVINKSAMISPSSSSSSNPFSPPSSGRNFSLSTFPVPNFLQQCFLCKQTLLPGKDIYMYKGDRAFCSVECRCRQIFMDEEETSKKENCSLAAMKAKPSTPSSSSPSGSRHHRKGARNRASGGGFVY